MDFVDLYNIAQGLITARSADGKTTVPVADLKDALIAGVPWLEAINFHPVELKPGDPLGHYECFSDTDSMWDEPNAWTAFITYGSDLNWCKRRFVWCKEMIHVFDTEDGCVKTPDEFRGLLQEVEVKPIEPSERYLTENTAKWLALLLLCPKTQRDEMKERAANEGLTDYDVALHFRVPEVIVSSLFSGYYDTYYQRFVEEA